MNNLKKLRAQHGLTQDDLGNILGVKKAAICKYETGRVSLPNSILLRLIDYFDVSADYILGMEEAAPLAKTAAPSIFKRVDDSQAVYVPLVGRVHAGTPVLADENITEYIPVSSGEIDRGEHFFMQVEGDCMTGDHIAEGALVLVHRISELSNNQIAVVRLGDEVLLRHIQYFDNHIALIPSNPAYIPHIVSQGDVEIIGRVVEVRIKF